MIQLPLEKTKLSNTAARCINIPQRALIMAMFPNAYNIQAASFRSAAIKAPCRRICDGLRSRCDLSGKRKRSILRPAEPLKGTLQ
jgi:hypothetical protein